MRNPSPDSSPGNLFPQFQAENPLPDSRMRIPSAYSRNDNALSDSRAGDPLPRFQAENPLPDFSDWDPFLILEREPPPPNSQMNIPFKDSRMRIPSLFQERTSFPDPRPWTTFRYISFHGSFFLFGILIIYCGLCLKQRPRNIQLFEYFFYLSWSATTLNKTPCMSLHWVFSWYLLI